MGSKLLDAIAPGVLLALHAAVVVVALERRGRMRRPGLVIGLALAPAVYGLGLLVAVVAGDGPARRAGLLLASWGPIAVPVLLVWAAAGADRAPGTTAPPAAAGPPDVAPAAPRAVGPAEVAAGAGAANLAPTPAGDTPVARATDPVAVAANAVPHPTAPPSTAASPGRRALVGALALLGAVAWGVLWSDLPELTAARVPRLGELAVAAHAAVALGAGALVLRGATGLGRRAFLLGAPLVLGGALWLLLKPPSVRASGFSSAALVGGELALLALASDGLGLSLARSTALTLRLVHALLLGTAAALGVVVAVRLGLLAWAPGPALACGLLALGLAVAWGELRPRVDPWLRGALDPEAARAAARLEALQGELAVARARLRETERASLVGRLAAQVAHEIKNPLGPIAGYARILEREAERQGALTPVVARGVAVIKEEVAAIDARARALLDLARPPRPTLGEHDVGALTDDVVALVRGDLPAGVTLAWTPPAAPAPAVTDRLLVRSALTNVVQNALGACAGGGRVTLRVAPDPGVGPGEPGAAWSVVVEDTGPGLPSGLDPEDLFRPFASGRPGGFGLGLITARGALEALGGALTLGPAPGGGVRAVLRVPLRATLPPELSPPAERPLEAGHAERPPAAGGGAPAGGSAPAREEPGGSAPVAGVLAVGEPGGLPIGAGGRGDEVASGVVGGDEPARGGAT